MERGIRLSSVFVLCLQFRYEMYRLRNSHFLSGNFKTLRETLVPVGNS